MNKTMMSTYKALGSQFFVDIALSENEKNEDEDLASREHMLLTTPSRA